MKRQGITLRPPNFESLSIARKGTSFISTPRLPPEVCERVIDWVPHYHGADHYFPFTCEKWTLLVCALVCRSWLPRSQTRLFQVVRLSKARQAEAFLDVITRSPSICSHVSILIFSPKPPPISISEVTSVRSQPDLSSSPGHYNWFYKILNILPILLGNVIKLQLESLPMLRPVTLALLSGFKRVQVLIFKFCSELSFAEIIRVVNRFSHLHTLHLYNCHWNLSSHCYSGKQHNLKRLDLSLTLGLQEFLGWVASSHSALALESLKAREGNIFIYENILMRLSYILQQSKSNLQDLELELWGDHLNTSG